MLKISQFTFNPIQENTYVITNGKNECLVIDPGCYFDNERKELTDFIDKNDLQPKCLLNTHCHLDHIFGNKLIGETYRLPIHIHRLEQPVLDNAAEAGERWNLPFENYTKNIIYVEDGDEVEFGEYRFKVLLTPGHSPGSISYYCALKKFVISGDVLFR